MIVEKKSPLTGKMNSMDLPITLQQMQNYYHKGFSIQKAFPDLTPDEREFFKTGITPTEYAGRFAEK